MKKLFGVAVLLASCSLGFGQAKETPKTIMQVLDSGVKIIESEFVPAAEAMPEDKYGFAPTAGEFKGVRTFAQQVKHVAAVNYMVGAAILQEKSPVDLGGENGPENIKSKADIVKFLKDSFAYAHKAVGSITPDNYMGEVPPPFGSTKATRAGLAGIIAWHGFDHYGQMVEYLRMNGIVPPASRGGQ
jgi:hypothetical protein